MIFDLSSVYKYILAANLDFIAIHTHCRVLLDLPRGDVVLPAMPWAGHDRSFQDSLPQRSAAVQASVVNRVVFPADIRQGYRLAFHLKFPDRTGRDFVCFRSSHKTHWLWFSFPAPCVSAFFLPSILAPASAPPSRPF